MWPFRRKNTSPTEAGPQPAPEPRTCAPAQARTADDVLRQLEAEPKAPAPSPPAAAPKAPPADPAIARCLLAEGPVTREFLDRQIAVAGKGDSYLGSLLAEARAPDEASLLAFLADGYQPPEVDLKQCRVHVPTARSISRELAVKYKMVPIERIGDIVCVVFAGEPNPKGIEAIRRETQARVKALRCRPHHLQILLRRLYARPAAATQVLAAVPITKREHDLAAASPAGRAEARWGALYASPGPIRASRLGRR